VNKLIIAEKPSVAQAIAKVLNATTKKDGYITGPGYIVSWCLGHLLATQYPDAYGERYKRWALEDLPIVPETWLYDVPKDKRKQYKVLSGLLNDKSVDTVICATDAGREGELIFRLVYNHCRCRKPVQRLWISSMEDSAIRVGLENLRDGADFDRLYDAALCREKADWLVGMNATRLFSVAFNSTLNIGRVMTPTLAMIVERGEKIAAFQKEKFYIVELDCGGFQAVSERMADRKAAEALRDACDGGGAAVAKLETTEKTVQPPKLYDLTSLQRDANRLFGYTAQQTLDCVQLLYEKKLCTYPRTDSRYITGDMRDSIPDLVDAVAAAIPFVSGLDLPVDTSRIVNDGKVSDHHAILPTVQIGSANLAALPTAEKNVLTMIAARLLCAVGEKHVYSETCAVLECGGNLFTAKGRTITADGWKKVDSAFRLMIKAKPDEGGNDDQNGALPLLERAQVVQPVKAALRERFTSPPKQFNEDSLLAAMESAGAEDMPEDAERKGIGTPATRAAIIEKLVKTGFIKREKKALIPEQKGIDLVSVLPDVIKSAKLTAEWETMLKQVERGELTAVAFMDGISAFVGGLVDTYGKAPDTAGAPVFQSDRPKRAAIGTCPRCGKLVYEGKQNFYCSNRDCGFVLWKNSKFFAAKKKTFTSEIAASLLKDGRVSMTGLYSEKTGKTYDATILLDDTGGKYINFKLEFTRE